MMVVAWLSFSLSLQYYSLLIKRVCIDFQMDAYTETGRKVCWWWVVVVGGNM
jgi:hypothetical protein